MIRQARAGLYVFATLFLAFETVACGGGSDPNRVLQSIAVTPPTADAQNFPNGKVQFTATGTFTQPPSSAPFPFTDPYGGSWQLSESMQSVATITQTGVAQCRPGASGTVTVEAMAEPGTCHGTQCTSPVIVGNATLTCP
jgi:hypothetical protein